MPDVGVLVGSESDRERMQAALDELDERGIEWEFEVRSAHRAPDAVAEYAKAARGRGVRVLICGAGLAAALPGVVAAHTELPVIGVPLRSSKSVLDGLDALGIGIVTTAELLRLPGDVKDLLEELEPVPAASR